MLLKCFYYHIIIRKGRDQVMEGHFLFSQVHSIFWSSYFILLICRALPFSIIIFTSLPSTNHLLPLVTSPGLSRAWYLASNFQEYNLEIKCNLMHLRHEIKHQTRSLGPFIILANSCFHPVSVSKCVNKQILTKHSRLSFLQKTDLNLPQLKKGAGEKRSTTEQIKQNKNMTGKMKAFILFWIKKKKSHRKPLLVITHGVSFSIPTVCLYSCVLF